MTPEVIAMCEHTGFPWHERFCVWLIPRAILDLPHHYVANTVVMWARTTTRLLGGLEPKDTATPDVREKTMRYLALGPVRPWRRAATAPLPPSVSDTHASSVCSISGWITCLH